MPVIAQSVPRLVRKFSPRLFIASRRQLSSVKSSYQTRFSYYISSKGDRHEIIDELRGSDVLENREGHNAAVILASPELTSQLEDKSFTSELVQLLSASGEVGDFHLLCAVVDEVAPALGQHIPTPGISVVRGQLDTLLPRLWQYDGSLEHVEKDAPGALVFDVGMSVQTLPLARTTFLNGRTSTLLASRYSLSQGAPRLQGGLEKQWQRIKIGLDRPVQSVADLGLWAPLSPVTRPRRITDSFGNIIRGIQVDGKSSPASTELEAAVTSLFENSNAGGTASGPMGVWALITPETSSSPGGDAPDPAETLAGRPLSRNVVEAASSYLQQQHRAGSRFYQVLSGGGGWGPKKGLLSLDPREAYFSLSEEEEMERFVKTMNKSGFAPPGAHVQFFVQALAPPEMTACSATGVVFGVPSGLDTEQADGHESKGHLVVGHLGALSSQGVYLSARPDAEAASSRESKLSVPGSRLLVEIREPKTVGGLFQFLGGGGLADAGTAALMS